MDKGFDFSGPRIERLRQDLEQQLKSLAQAPAVVDMAAWDEQVQAFAKSHESTLQTCGWIWFAGLVVRVTDMRQSKE